MKSAVVVTINVMTTKYIADASNVLDEVVVRRLDFDLDLVVIIATAAVATAGGFIVGLILNLFYW